MQSFPCFSSYTRFAGLGLLAVALGACQLLIPENPSAPRYNEVLGESRSPKLNPGGGGVGSQYVGPQAALQAAPTPPEPVAEAPRTAAEQPQPAAVQAVEAIVNEHEHIETAEVPPAVPAAAPPAVAGRQVPEENRQPVQVAGRFPDVHSIPPTPPSGLDGDAARLEQVRRQLETERSQADDARARLATDAAAEPSLADTPLPEPVQPPAVPAAALDAPQALATPVVASAPVTASAVAETVPQQAAPEPIVLRQPPADTAAAPVGVASAARGAEPIVLRAPGSFTSTTPYLPASRYATRRVAAGQ